MAGFQLAGPAADMSKNLYGINRRLCGEPKRTVQYIVILLFVWAPHTNCDLYGTKF